MSDKLNEPKEIIKLEKKLGAAFADEIRSLSPADLENRLKGLAVYAQEIADSKANDERLTELREQVRVASASYNEALRDNKSRQRFVYLVLTEEKGK